MAKPITIPNTFASATSAIPLSQLDQDFSTLANSTNDLATYSNYVADTGAADAFIANYPANTNTSSLTTGLRLQFKAANANTGASTLNVQVNGASIGTASIRLTDGSALPANTIIAGALVDVMYDGTNFQIMNDPSGGQEIISNLTLSGNLTVAGTSTFTGNVTGNVVNTTTSTITNLTSSNVTITGGSIDNISITNLTSLTVDGNTTLGDASGDTLTITGTTVTTPNGLNFDSNTLVIDATNNRVGIGTTSPVAKLDVNGDYQGAGNIITSSGVIRAPDGSAATPSIQPGVDADTGFFRPVTNTIGFSTAGTERMRIDSSGNVGIGTTAPNARATIKALGNAYTNGALAIVSSASNSSYLTNVNGNLYVSNDGSTDHLVLNSSGNLGLGVTPSAWGSGYRVQQFNKGSAAAAFVGDANNETMLGRNAFHNGTNWIYYSSSSPANIYQQSSGGQHIWYNAPSGTAGNAISFTQAMTLDASGNLGIGTSSPAARLDLGSGSAGVGFKMQDQWADIITSVSVVGSRWYYGASTVYGRAYANATGFNIDTSTSAVPIVFGTNNTERMRITSTGDVGIGTSSPTTKLDVNGGVAVTGTTSFSLQRPIIPSAVDQGTPAIQFKYYSTGTTYTIGAQISSLTAGAWSSTSAPTNMVFYTVPSGSTTIVERLRIDSSGNIGIGTSSPVGALDIVTSGGGLIRMRSSTGSGTVGFQAQNSDTGTTVTDGFFCGIDGSEQAYVYNYENTPLLFGTNNAERMRITSDGDLLIGTTSNSLTTVGVKFINYGSSAYNIALADISSVNTDIRYTLYSTGASAYRFYVGMGGTIYATSTTITAISDARLKENIQDIDVGLDAVMALKPRKFDWKVGKGKDKKGDRGWIAQEFEEVFPEMIDEWKDPAPEGEEPYKSVNADLIPVLVKAIQEQQAMIVELTNRIKKLEGA